MNHIQRKISGGIGLLVVLCLLGFAGQMDYEDAIASENHYCSMVTEFKRSNGQYGWPDFKNIYSSACDKATTK